MSSRAVSAIDHSIAATLSLEGSSSIAGEWFAPWRGNARSSGGEELRTICAFWIIELVVNLRTGKCDVTSAADTVKGLES